MLEIIFFGLAFFRDLKDEQVFNGLKNCLFYLSQNFLIILHFLISKENKEELQKDKFAVLCKKAINENKTWLSKSNNKKNFQNHNAAIKNILKNIIK